jgi:glutamine synthetase
VADFHKAIVGLEQANEDPGLEGMDEALHFRDTVIPAMTAVREVADRLERLVADDLWPLPKYSEVLFIK